MIHARHLALECLVLSALLIQGGVATVDAQSVQTFNEAAATASRLLQSPDAKDLAWGAFTAAQYHVASAIPLLITALQRDLPAGADPYGAAELAILDALVQLGAEVPAETLQRSVTRWRIPTLILLARATGNKDAVLLPRLNVTTGLEWDAVANLLLATKPSGFAFRLLDGLQLQLRIYVADQPNALGSGMGGGTEGDCNVVYPGPGFPPLADYDFTWAGPGATILSVGPETVYYVRRVRQPSIVPCSDRGRVEKPRDWDRVKYVNALAGGQWLRQETYVTIVWKKPDDFRPEVSRHRRAVADQYRNLVFLLVSAKQLTEGESRTLTPNITVTVEDGRKDKSAPLPRP